MSAFVSYALDLAKLTVEYSEEMQEEQQATTQQEQEDRVACYQRFCDQQCKNDKTSRILQATFGEDFAREYLQQVLFDNPH